MEGHRAILGLIAWTLGKAHVKGHMVRKDFASMNSLNSFVLTICIMLFSLVETVVLLVRHGWCEKGLRVKCLVEALEELKGPEHGCPAPNRRPGSSFLPSFQ